MKRAEILKENRAFSFTCRNGKRKHGKLVLCFIRKRRDVRIRVGVTCASSFSGAVARNRGKRILREAFRSLELNIKGGFDIVLLLKKEENVGSDEVRRDIQKIFTSLEMIDKNMEEAGLGFQ